MTTMRAPWIGKRMREITAFVALHPGCTKMAAADQLTYPGGGKSRRHGYAAVDRAIAAGLIRAEERADRRRGFRLYVTTPSTFMRAVRATRKDTTS